MRSTLNSAKTVIEGIIADFIQRDGHICRAAERKLVDLGVAAFAPLLLSFGERSQQRREIEMEYSSRFLHIRIRVLAMSLLALLCWNAHYISAQIAVPAIVACLLFVAAYSILCAPEAYYFPRWQRAALDALGIVLQNHRLRDVAPLSASELASLYVILGCSSKVGDDHYRPDLAASILWELPEVADWRAVDMVRALAQEQPDDHTHPFILRAARNCLPLMEEKLESERRNGTLLRAAMPSESEFLVRMAALEITGDDRLLRVPEPQHTKEHFKNDP